MISASNSIWETFTQKGLFGTSNRIWEQQYNTQDYVNDLYLK